MTCSRPHIERFYSIWALLLHALFIGGVLPQWLSTWYVAIFVAMGSVIHSVTWNRKYYNLYLDLLIHWVPFIWIRPQWGYPGFLFFLLTLALYIYAFGGVETVLLYYKDAQRALFEESYPA